jgi:DNA-binding response OmpR family regulator
MSQGKVLVVDDDNNICELLKLYLEKEGYGVVISHDGDEAVAKFNALKPDIVCWTSCFRSLTAGRYA